MEVDGPPMLTWVLFLAFFGSGNGTSKTNLAGPGLGDSRMSVADWGLVYAGELISQLF